jgi:RNA polymerase sigma-70 factor, ECF subfamily
MGRAGLALVRPPPEAAAEPVTDAALAARLANGDREALEEVYARHAPDLFRMLVRLLSRTGEAEDVLQETFVIAFQKAGQLRDEGALRGWLFQVAVREAHARLRRRKRWSFFGMGGSGAESEDAASLASLVADTAGGDARAELALLDRELGKLPPEQRIAWMLRYVEGEGLEDVAAACGCSLATAKRWLSAADAVVRRHVQIEEASE